MLDKSTIKSLLESRFIDDQITTLSLLPKPAVFVNMQAAIERISKAIETREKITVIGDYDVDGVTSCSIMKIFFDYIKYPVEIIIPNRFTDGYGLSTKIAEKIAEGVVITVDNGISAIESAQILSRNKIDLIIIDHHTIGAELPSTLAIIHPIMTEPKLDVTDICAASVVWYFIAALKNELKSEFDIKSLLPLVAIATIADVMPLICINRTLVKAGLNQLNISQMPFAIALRNVISGKFSSETIAFQVSPRLNSAGRMSSAAIAYEFLSADNLSTANQKLEELTSLNNDRKCVELETYELALRQVNAEDAITVVWGENWHEGVIGIVASRLVSKFKRPAIVLSVHENRAKGSARSLGGVSIFALINSARELLIGFGGHKMAAGVTLKVENLKEFRKRINEEALKRDQSERDCAPLHMGELSLQYANLDMCELLEEFEPYGQGNEKPRFFAVDATIEKIDFVGKDKSVSKLIVSENGTKVEAVYFGVKEGLVAGDKSRFLYNIVKNTYGGVAKAKIEIHQFVDDDL